MRTNFPWFMLALFLASCSSLAEIQPTRTPELAPSTSSPTAIPVASPTLETPTPTQASTETPTPLPTPTEVPECNLVFSNGETLVVPQLATTKELIEFIKTNASPQKGGDTERNSLVSWLEKAKGKEIFKKIKTIPGYRMIFGQYGTFGTEPDTYVLMKIYAISGETPGAEKVLVTYPNKNKEEQLDFVCVDASPDSVLEDILKFDVQTKK